MNPTFASLPRRLRSITIGLVACPLAAQIPIGGNQSGTLAAGVYITNASLNVPAGQTWILDPGVIIKFTSSGHELSVNGTLHANGTAANKVILTDYADDSAGGDTNGNGASVGTATSWRGVVYQGTGSGTLNYADIRYGGAGFISNVHIVSASATPTFVHCTLRNNYVGGMNLSGNAGATVTNCTFTDNGGAAIDNVPIQALPLLSGNTASGNGNGNYARVTVANVTGNLSLGPAAHMNGALVFDAGISVASGAALTLQAGTILKMRNSGVEVTVDGALHANGTAGSPVILTGLTDDTAGGDTDANGPSAGFATSWRGVVYQGSGSGTLNHADIRYGGAGFISNVHLVSGSATPTFVNCTLRNNYVGGINLSGHAGATVTDCTFTDNGGAAIDNVPIQALPLLSGNTASGNGNGNYARVTFASVTGNLSVGPAAHINGAIVFDTGIAVASGAALTLQAGTILKMRNSGVEVTVDGALHANGTAGSPVILTGLTDDSAGGDTDANGPSAGFATSWRGVVYQGSGSGTLNYADIRFGGAGFISNVHLVSASATPTLDHCTLRNNYVSGMNLNGSAGATVRNCTFADNAAWPVDAVPLSAVPGFTNNTASGNANGNGLHVTNGTVAAPLTIGPQSVMAGALVMGASLNVTATGALTVQQGVNFKMENSGIEVVVDGILNLRGTSYEPVVFTGYADDSVGGDTNNNGPSAAAASAWRGVIYHAGAPASILENVVVRYTGAGFVPGLTCSNGLVSLRSVRVDQAYDRGIVLSAAANDPANLIAWGCGSHGMHLTGGGFQIVHATCSGNGTGIRREPAWTGNVVNSISRGNGTNFSNVAPSQVLYCDGFVGGVGNLDVDPQFVNAALGDLHLQANSPCLGAADILQAFFAVKDFDENSRLLDHALLGVPLPDMGAFERSAWTVTVDGVGQLGTALTYTVTGPAGASFYLFGLLDGAVPLVPYGMVLVAAQTSSILFLTAAPVATNSPFQLVVPNIPPLAGFAAGVQTITLSATNPSVGNTTRMHRVLLRP